MNISVYGHQNKNRQNGHQFPLLNVYSKVWRGSSVYNFDSWIAGIDGYDSPVDDDDWSNNEKVQKVIIMTDECIVRRSSVAARCLNECRSLAFCGRTSSSDCQCMRGCVLSRELLQK